MGKSGEFQVFVMFTKHYKKSAPSYLIIAVKGPVVSFRAENRRRKKRGEKEEKLTSGKNPQNNASFYNHWGQSATRDYVLCLVVYLICIELPLLEAWVHVLGLNLLLGRMDLEMLILSLRMEGKRAHVFYNALKTCSCRQNINVHVCSINCFFILFF